MNELNRPDSLDPNEDGEAVCYDRYKPLTAALDDLVEQYRSQHSSRAPSIEDYLVAARRLVLEGHDPTTVTVAAMGSVAVYFNAELCRWQSRVSYRSGEISPWRETPWWQG